MLNWIDLDERKPTTFDCYAVGDVVVVTKDQDCWSCGLSHPKRGDRVTIRAVGKESVQFTDLHGRVSAIWERDLEFAND